jgi:pimeloyl-ACP methyl ester carboxylesterase
LLLGACASTMDPVAADPTSIDTQFPAAMAAVTIPSAGNLMLSRAYIPQGAGPHPTVILMHGFPGNELNLDLAQAMRRAGWTVLTFHYRGAWGSGGDFSFTNAIDDVSAAIAYARSAEGARRLRSDPTRIVLIGHSMGSFTGLQAAARDASVKAIAAITSWSPILLGEAASRNAEVRKRVQDGLQGAMSPLKGASGESLTEDAIQHAPEWQYQRLAPLLAGRSVLLVGATRDTVAPVKDYHAPLAAALKSSPSIRLSETLIDTDHALSDRRVALAHTVISWLDQQR